MQELERLQKAMPEWTEHLDEDSEIEVLHGLLYSLKRLYQYAPDHPRLIVPATLRAQVVSRAHLEVGPMSHLKTMRKMRSSGQG